MANFLGLGALKPSQPIGSEKESHFKYLLLNYGHFVCVSVVILWTESCLFWIAQIINMALVIPFPRIFGDKDLFKLQPRD